MVNFANYVFQPRPLQQWDVGRGFRDVIQAHQQKEIAGRQERQFQQNRGDSQAEFSANFAKDRGNAGYDQQKARHDKQAELILKARAAAQAGHHDTARALIPQILELGGEASEQPGPDGPFRFKASDAPSRAPLDFGGTRSSIYGGSRNPMDPAALPGASAAAMPPQRNGITPGGSSPAQNQSPPPVASGAQPSVSPAADPPPGAARSMAPPGSVWLPPGMDPGTTGAPPPEPAAAQTQPSPTSSPSSPAAPAPPEGVAPPGAPQAQQSGSPQLTGPNPFSAPGLDPYTIDPERVREQNRQRLEPFLGGVAKAAGSRYKTRIEDINKYVSELGLPPDEAIKVTEKLYGEVFGLARSELAMEGQAGRAAMTGRQQESIRYDRDRDRGLKIANARVNIEDLAGTKKKLRVSRGVEDLLSIAHKNGQAANALIRQVYKMYAEGVMTDRDYVDTKEGVTALFQKVKNGTLEQLNPHGGGLAPDIVANMKELVEKALKGHRRSAMEARDTLYRAYKANNNEAEREAIRETLESVLPEEYYPPEFSQQPGSVPEYEPEQEGAVMDSLNSGESLGVVPLPKEPNRAGAVRGTRVAAKPPRKLKPVGQMTKEDMKAEMERILKEGADAP